ncbi:pentapeptide repeat-containing protein [Anabaena azotica]|uniref:non-specific serine/threonine protein kinase n=1 Tax=Anabaena azotica FACHB-119 TaxID=947527 RepID=A0ABR8D272_9NOST|nr:pentapeptide repeat-containing protein [Anabaena azotica]MBD2500360.1 pentapeptide repeat-containing protein [Anabaena azotica FACHB-119]
MIKYPDFSSHGYQIERELGRNLTGGRITYMAQSIRTGQNVVIKQFQFAQPMGNWRDYDTIHQEIKVLQKLNHPSIPRYLNSFETSTGFCLVQEYKNAPSLAVASDLSPEDIQQIAVKCLEMLIYLQQQQPVVIHRDIKPENILVSQDKKVYLVDFGLAKLEEGEISSTIAKGTFGFMPPEQIYKRQLTKGSDLYSLGATIICLLTNTKSINIGDLIDENERINFRKKLPKLPRSFVLWLQKMVERKLEKRFLNAEEAQKALKLSTNGSSINSIPAFNSRLINLSAAGLLCFTLLILIIDQGNKWIEHESILAEQERQAKLEEQIQAERQRIEAEQEAERQRIEAEQEAERQRIKAQREAERQRIKAQREAEKKRIEAQREAERKRIEAQRETERKRIEAQKQALVIQLQENKSCIGCDLSGANLKGLFLENVNLEKANLQRANLSGAKLKGANLSFAKLQNAELEDSDLENAKLQNAELENANLQGAKLISAQLEDANLQNANLQGARLIAVNLKNARLQNTNLENASFEYDSLYASVEANLENANLQGANLRNANLTGANLKNTNLKNADLREAKLYRANLDGAQTVNAKFDGSYR